MSGCLGFIAPEFSKLYKLSQKVVCGDLLKEFTCGHVGIASQTAPARTCRPLLKAGTQRPLPTATPELAGVPPPIRQRPGASAPFATLQTKRLTLIGRCLRCRTKLRRLLSRSEDESATTRYHVSTYRRPRFYAKANSQQALRAWLRIV